MLDTLITGVIESCGSGSHSGYIFAFLPYLINRVKKVKIVLNPGVMEKVTGNNACTGYMNQLDSYNWEMKWVANFVKYVRDIDEGAKMVVEKIDTYGFWLC